MKNKTLSIPAASAILIVWLFAVSAGAIPPPARPPSPFAPKEQNLLTEYERKVLNIELQKLTAEIKEARFEAAGDPSLKQLKENLEKALKSNDKQQISEAEEKLTEAVESIFRKQEGMGQKMARLNDIGTLMRYDNLDKKHRRARQGSAARRLIVDGNAVVEIGPPPASPAPQDVALENTSTNRVTKRIFILSTRNER